MQTDGSCNVPQNSSSGLVVKEMDCNLANGFVPTETYMSH